MPRSKTESITLDEPKVRFEEWRRNRKGRASIPDELWASAVEVARKEGVSRTSTELRVEWNHLKRRMAAASVATPKAVPPAFVELVAPDRASLPECTIELEGRRGKLRIELKGASALPSEVKPVGLDTAGAFDRAPPANFEQTRAFVADESSDIAPPVSGRVISTPVGIGADVVQGQIVCELDHRDAQLKLDQARTQFAEARPIPPARATKQFSPRRPLQTARRPSSRRPKKASPIPPFALPSMVSSPPVR